MNNQYTQKHGGLSSAYAKWKKSDTKDYMLCDAIHMTFKKMPKYWDR